MTKSNNPLASRNPDETSRDVSGKAGFPIDDDELRSMVLDTSDPPQRASSAYLPTDLLRVLRPRTGER